MSNSYDSQQQSKHTRKQTEHNQQPLIRSTYNIFEAYDIDMAVCGGDSLNSVTSVHPLQTPYALDLVDPHQHTTKATQNDLNTMMKNLNLVGPDKQRDTSMPYCV